MRASKYHAPVDLFPEVKHIVIIPPIMMKREEMEDFYCRKLNNIPRHLLPPTVNHQTNLWYFPAVHQWLMQNSSGIH